MKNFQSQSRKRYFSLDILRSFAILCVILVHTTERVYSINLEEMANYTLQRKVFALMLFTIGRMGVPIFLFLTGYLLLNRHYNRENTVCFYKRNFIGLILTAEIWIVFYNLFNSWFYQSPLSIDELLRNMLYLKATNMSHMWYIPAILGIYVFIPFVSRALEETGEMPNSEQMSKSYTVAIRLIICGILFYVYIIPELNIILQCKKTELFNSLPSMEFSGGVYGFPLILGFLVQKKYFRKIPAVSLKIAGTGCFVFTVWLQLYSYEYGVGYNVWYNNATLLLACLALFELVSRYEDRNSKLSGEISCFDHLKNAIQSLAKCSFGIYLVHNPINMLLIRYVYTESSVIRLALIGSITLFCSWGMVYMICKHNKWGAKILFNYK